MNNNPKESVLWQVIEDMDFNARGYRNAGNYLINESGLSFEGMQQVVQFANAKVDELYSKLMEAGHYLGSDDGYSDLLWQIVANGEDFYNNITVEEAKKMIDEDRYTESFAYAFHQFYDLEDEEFNQNN
jgi:hypothetical protein